MIHDYIFTAEQLDKLLDGTIEMFVEWRDQHARDEQSARVLAVREMFEGLEAEREMVWHGEMERATTQVFTERASVDVYHASQEATQ